MKTFDQGVSRRTFLKAGSLTGVALSLGFSFSAKGEPGEIISADSKSLELNAWISIDTSGKVTLTTGSPRRPRCASSSR